MSTASTNERPYIGRRSLRAYHRDTADLVMLLVNDLGLRYRLTRNTVLIYPPDGTTPPFTVPARAHWEPKPLARWAAANVPEFARAITEEAVKRNVAELVDREKEEMTEEPLTMPETSDDEDVQEALTEASTDNLPPVPEGWDEYRGVDGDTSTLFAVRNDSEWMCRLCEWHTSNRSGLGGHTRMAHGDRSTLHTPEALAKARDTRRARKAERQMRMERDRLQATLDYIVEAVRSVTGEDTRVQELEEQVRELTAQVEAHRKRGDDAEARLALVREAFGA